MQNRSMAHLIALITLLFLSGPAIAADKELPFNSTQLVQVKTLAAFPRAVTALLGADQPGANGMADYLQKFNAAGDVHSTLPLRRFYAGGASSLGAVVVYESGGQPPTYHAVAFTMTPSGWTQLSEWNLGAQRVSFRESLEEIDPARYPDAARRKRWDHIARTQPGRRDGPLRETNLSDTESREIQAEASKVYPGAILNISGVVTGCPCEEGPACTDQVWVVAHSQGKTSGLQLSHVGGIWMVGVLQQWWLSYAKLEADRTLSRLERAEATQSLWDGFPACTQDTAKPSH